MVTGEECTEYFPINTNIFFRNKADVVEFVDEALQSFQSDCPLTITIERERFVGSYVLTVICASLEDTQTLNSSIKQLLISKDTPDGSSQ